MLFDFIKQKTMTHINFKLGIKAFIMVFVFIINMLGCSKDKIIAEKNIDPNVISEIKKNNDNSHYNTIFSIFSLCSS